MVSRFLTLIFVLLSASTIKAKVDYAGKEMEKLMQMIARSKLIPKDLEGVWEGDIENADCAILVNGQVATVCRDSLPPDCAEELPVGHEKYIFHNGTIYQQYIHLEGIKTEKDAKRAFPICAKHEIYPTEFKIAVPESHIVAYNPFNGFLTYHDARRPLSTDCIIALYSWTKEGDPFITFQQIVGFKGSLEEVMKNGPSVRCRNPPKKCEVGFDEEGVLHLDFHNIFDLKRTSPSSPKTFFLSKDAQVTTVV